MLTKYHGIPTETLRCDSGIKILQLLEEDAQLAMYDHAAESLQLELVMESTLQNDTTSSSSLIENSTSQSLDDKSLGLALQLEAQELQKESDARLAQELYGSVVADEIASQQTLQKLAAEERNVATDAAFARALQADLNAGHDNFHDAEQLLGVDAVMRTLRLTNDSFSLLGQGKGKEKAAVEGVDELEASIIQADDHIDGSVIGGQEQTLAKLCFPELECGICFEPIGTLVGSLHPTGAASSSRTLFGIGLSCPERHAFCLDCLRKRVRAAFEDANYGGCIFPIGCPQCDLSRSDWSISDQEASRFLTPGDWDKWIELRDRESREKIYCSKAKCSALLFIDDLDSSRAPLSICPFCDTLLCTSCVSAWHTDLTCDEYQALPEDERLPEDLLLLSKARVEHWRRCPGCKIVIALTDGCRHIVCRCGTQFCYRCGAVWSKTQCSRVPSCDLWSEEELVQDSDEQLPQGEVPPNLDRFVTVDGLGLPVLEDAMRRIAYGEDHQQKEPDSPRPWSPEPGEPSDSSHYSIQTPVAHKFTDQMFSSLTCGYCFRRFFSLRSLMQHLKDVRKHPVWTCCGRWFNQSADFKKHRASVHR